MHIENLEIKMIQFYKFMSIDMYFVSLGTVKI